MKASLRARPLDINRQLRYHLITTPSLEAWANNLIDQSANHTVQVGVVRDETVSQETQQMDEQNATAQVQRLQDQIDQFLPQAEFTGHPAHFLIDPDQVAAGDIEAQSTLTAIAEKAMGSEEEVIVALLPLSAKQTASEETAEPEADVITGQGVGIAQSLESLGVTVYTDRDRFIQYLRHL